MVFRVEVESDTHRSFWASLRDPGSSRIVWRSPDLTAEAGANARVVTLTVPADTLRAQLYSIELRGFAVTGSADLLGQYPIRVVLE